jgi:hypothetical protein
MFVSFHLNFVVDVIIDLIVYEDLQIVVVVDYYDKHHHDVEGDL